MSGTNKKLTNAVEQYFTDLRRIRASGGATGERSSYPALSKLLDAVGATLRPKVFCVADMADQGAGHPDFGLYSQRQLQRGVPGKGQAPERGVVEVKSPGDDMQETFREQVARYGERYRLVLATNQREFRLTAVEAGGVTSTLESFGLAGTEAAFAHKLEHPRAFARESGAGLGEYLSRALSHRATLVDPKDVAWLLASYARDGLARVEAAGDPPSLRGLRSALEEALGVRFEGARGTRFFHSTLVQTLFYGIFSAWVLWSRHEGSDDAQSGTEGGPARFSWREAVWHLRAPVLRALFQQVADPGRLQRLDLVEVLDWTAAALDRVDRTAFFSRFNEGEAVPYFYEPFLQAFDPELRKQLGVWYTPTEVVRYMVARVDKALKDDLGIADGLAAENVYVLDPCCGTGAYLAEVLRRIAANLEGQGFGALTGARVKQAATQRVFGFEIMPAPFVVAHLQVGLTMQDLDAALADDGAERAGIFLTNALTGWEPHTSKPLPFPELEEERDRAEQVKQEKPILVILGNPPYNGFAGMAVDEERELSVAYRKTRRVRRPEGQGLNDLYVRFFRMAERRIAEKTGQGVICFISNYSWLDGLSFTGMRERYLEAFDEIRIDCLNGDKYRTGKVAPDGSPDPSIFSTEGDPVGIQVGTAITTMVRRADHAQTRHVGFRNLWGQGKRAELTATAETEPDSLYEDVTPVLPLGLPFARTAVSDEWFNWPALPELFPASFPGVKTSRDRFLVDVDLDRLKARLADYFDPGLSHDEIARRYPDIMRTTARFDSRAVRGTLLARGGPDEAGFIRFAYRPFDNRWLYWEKDTKLLDEKRADYRPHVFDGNRWLVTQKKPRRAWSVPQVISSLGCLDLLDRGATCFPAWFREDYSGVGLDLSGPRRGNLSAQAKRYLDALGAEVDDMFQHVLAVLHDSAYHEANAGALRMGWPRIPLPGWPRGEVAGAAEALAESAERGRRLAALLDSETPVPGVTRGALSPAIASIAVPATTDDGNMVSEDFAVTAGWGHFGIRRAVMPGQGCFVERPFSAEERLAMGDRIGTLGDTTFDIYINARAFWRNVPAAVWSYKLGGYQVLKKWLSYRERAILDRPLTTPEVQHFSDIARRLAAILLPRTLSCE
ncbi:type ISP restriction/modification enzyme [Candidatus Palauibacter sp.]|uniref:type ISP restriction/modification enzyme n=1 Tax=Candidatus Palauibacter sp. TaxID=3101350 RepID=UPI003B020B9C